LQEEFVLAGEIVEGGAKGFLRNAAAEAGAKIFAENARGKRIFLVEAINAGEQAGANFGEA